MWNPYCFSLDAPAALRIVLRECSDCGRDFEPLNSAMDCFCDECWNDRQQLEEDEA